MPKKILLLFILLFRLTITHAQQSWATPELSRMYYNAQEYIALGNYKEAITIYKQALLIDPDKFLLCKELGKAQCLSGDYGAAIHTLAPLHGRPEVDEECYQLLAESYARLQNTKDARATLSKGLAQFPASGLLYYETGKMYALENKPAAALDAWLDGIKFAPEYPRNYHEAARAYFTSDKVIWGLLYGETYLNIAKDTTGAAEIKKMLLIAYKTMFDKIAELKTNRQPVNSFTDAIQDVYRSLTPVISDGITTENLTMVRTRFLMDWFTKYGARYPYSLFTYQDYLLRNGLFDICNEWLFGKAANAAEYEAWNQFHPGEIDLFLQKQKEHPLVPLATDFYNDRNIDGLFPKKR